MSQVKRAIIAITLIGCANTSQPLPRAVYFDSSVNSVDRLWFAVASEQWNDVVGAPVLMVPSNALIVSHTAASAPCGVFVEATTDEPEQAVELESECRTHIRYKLGKLSPCEVVQDLGASLGVVDDRACADQVQPPTEDLGAEVRRVWGL